MTASPGCTTAPPQAIGTLKLPPTSWSRVVMGDTPRHHTGRS